MNIILNIDDAQEARVIGKIAKNNGWTPQIVNVELGIVDNPVSKKEFVKQLIINYIKTQLQQAERQEVLDQVVVSDELQIG